MEKICIFYASKNHLSVILLKLLNSNNVKKYTVKTILENSIKDEMKVLKEKYNIKINSRNKVEFKKTNIKENKNDKITDNMIVIIQGKIEYIKEVNRRLEEQERNQKLKNLKIINCYEFNMKKQNLKEIINENKKILLTTGEKNLTNLI